VRSSISRVLHVAYYQIGIGSRDNRPHATWPTCVRGDNVALRPVARTSTTICTTTTKWKWLLLLHLKYFFRF
jgi:hypothetical protein